MSPKKKTTRKTPLKGAANEKFLTPLMSEASRGGTSYRGTSAGKVSLKDQLCNIDSGILPYTKSSHGYVSVTDAIILAQKAYYNVSIFKNTIDTQSEFANSPLHFVGGSKKSRAFYEAWYKKIKGWKLSQQFFLEWFRSSNFISYKTYTTLDQELVKGLKEEFGFDSVPKSAIGKKIPLRYIVLNPADLSCDPSSSFSEANYSKLLNAYEVERLKNAVTPEDKEFLASLPPEARRQIKSGSQVFVPLKPQDIVTVFAKKQDYEPMSVPMYFPVLFDINTKLEFKKAELAIARQVDYMVLLVTMGDKENGVDAKVADSMRELFKTSSVARVLVADYTTKVEFIIPDFSKIMGPDKYQVVNKDITNGLMNLFFEDEKFASGLIKTKIFLERLNESRRAFINDFLLPEMEFIADELGLRDVPTPKFEEIDLQDEVQLDKVYTRLAEIGFLTPEEYFEASETGILPTKEGSIESQKEFKKLKDQDLYQPLIGGAKEQEEGRPSGSKAPQSTKKVSPQKSVGTYSIFAVKDTAQAMTRLNDLVESEFKSRNKLQRLSAKNKTLAFEITKQVSSNEPMSEWESSYKKYFDGFVAPSETFDKITTLAAEHGIDIASATLLFNSPYESNKTETA